METEKKGFTKRNCNNCGKEYFADNRNLKRGWGLCCDKSCGAKLREKNKPTWNKDNVERNNRIRENFGKNGDYGDDCSIDEYHDSIHSGSDEAFE